MVAVIFLVVLWGGGLAVPHAALAASPAEAAVVEQALQELNQENYEEAAMAGLEDIHRIALEQLQKRFSLTAADLKHPLPERPLRTLGMMKIDGRAFSSDDFARLLILNITLPFFSSVRTVFLGPRIELGLPVFSADIILGVRKHIFFLDIQFRHR